MASLKSFDQYTVDNNTFITEAKLKDKLITGKIGRNYGSFTRNSEGVSDMSATSNRGTNNCIKGFIGIFL